MAVNQADRQIVGAAAKAAGAIGVPGAFSFGLDVTAMTGIWAAMIIGISRRSGHVMNSTFAMKLATGVGAGVAAYVGGSKLALNLLHLIPGAGSLAAIGVNSGLNYLFTYKLGHAMSKLFEKGSFDDSDVNGVVVTLLTLVAAIPTFEEWGDMLALAGEPVDSTVLDSFKQSGHPMGKGPLRF